MATGKLIQNRHNGKVLSYDYRGFHIESVGGFCTIKRFTADNGSLWFWCFKRAEVLEMIDAVLDNGLKFNDIPELYRKGLYI